jgi:Amt family ammonium transporter
MQFRSYVIYTLFLCGFIYPVVAHWGWSGNGWASAISISGIDIAVIDFAGSGVVHMVGGVAALVGCSALGVRIGWTADKGLPAQNAVFSTLGTFLLWFVENR